jgi:hypothetical protein
MLSGVFTVLGGVFVLAVVLLAVPIVFAWRVAWPADADNRMELRWLFGLVRVRLPDSAGGAAPSAAGRDGSGRFHEYEARGGTRIFRAFAYRPFRRRLVRYLRRLWQLIDKDDVRLRVRIGLDDPAATGQLWAVMGPLAALLAVPGSVVVSIEPDFVDQAFEVDSSGRLRVVPLQMLASTLALAFSPDLWRGLRRMRGD